MKRILALFLTVILMTSFVPPVFAEESKVEYVTDKITVVVRGDAGAAAADKSAALLLLKGVKTPSEISQASDIYGIDETKTDEYGKYEFEVGIKNVDFDESGLSDGHLFIKVGDKDITDTVISANTKTSKHFFADMKTYADETGKYANLVIRSPKNLVDDIFFVAAQYDKDNRLISAEKPNVKIENGGADIKVSIIPADDAKYCRVYGWYNDLSPFGSAVTSQKTPKEILVIGNSFSVDSTRYVHKLAQSLGIELNVHLYQHSGGTVSSLYEDRCGGTLVQDPPPTQNSYTYAKNQWYYSKNYNENSSSSVGLWLDGVARNPALDEFLDQTKVDAVVIQNYWAQQEAISQYEDPGNDAGSDGKNYYPSPHYVTMAKYIKEKQPDAEIFINSIWSNEDGYYFAKYVSSNYAANGFENESAFMYDLLEKYNGQSAIDVGAATLSDGSAIGVMGKSVTQLPVGYAIQYARNYTDKNGNKIFFTTKNPDDFSGWDDSTKYPAPVYEGKIRLNRDGYHLSPAGRYLAGCVWIETITGRDVREATYKPEYEEFKVEILASDGSTSNKKATYYYDEMDSETASLIREIAHTAAQKFNSQKVRGLNDLSLK